VQQLIHTQPHEIDEIGIDTRQPTAHSFLENRVDRSALAKHSVDELAQPPAVPRIEIDGPPLERRIEHFTASQVGRDTSSNDARRGYAADCNL
jgi:hypothetical protein